MLNEIGEGAHGKPLIGSVFVIAQRSRAANAKTLEITAMIWPSFDPDRHTLTALTRDSR